LEPKCKSYKRNKKEEKEKEEKKKKHEKGPGGNNLALLQIGPMAQEAFPNQYLSPLSLSLTCRPHLSGQVTVFLPRPEISRRDIARVNLGRD
jgi:hypothetical protein